MRKISPLQRGWLRGRTTVATATHTLEGREKAHKPKPITLPRLKCLEEPFEEDEDTPCPSRPR